jgi:hypothetical protein
MRQDDEGSARRARTTAICAKATPRIELQQTLKVERWNRRSRDCVRVRRIREAAKESRQSPGLPKKSITDGKLVNKLDLKHQRIKVGGKVISPACQAKIVGFNLSLDWFWRPGLKQPWYDPDYRGARAALACRRPVIRNRAATNIALASACF